MIVIKKSHDRPIKVLRVVVVGALSLFTLIELIIGIQVLTGLHEIQLWAIMCVFVQLLTSRFSPDE